ncbi:MAG TPA: GDSL-type esterase/lipase family protein [Planctomycetota bacterium]|nr:GDSL-type esterase/lipase family protein [Planctomycetota bacterium]
MKLHLSLSTLCMLASAGMRAGDEPVTPPPAKQDPTVAERGYFEKYPQAWNTFHKTFVERAKKGGVDLLFLGDSLTQGWGDAAQKDLWKKYFEPFKPANFGIGGDRTQQILWRIGNGELEGISPKVVVLMIGVNNFWSNDSAEKVAEGTKKIVELLRQKLPNAKILLLGILPAQQNASGGLRAKIKSINAITAKLDDGKNVRFLDMGPKFVDASGNIAPEKEFFQADFLHLTTKGYELWAETMKPLLDEMMK